MPFPMTHMQIAYQMLDRLSGMERPADYMLGSIAPDAVHFCRQYNVGMKETSHLWHYGPKWGITLDAESWKKNILNFWMREKGSGNQDFTAGYCVHILTDWLYDRRIWSPFRQMYEGAGGMPEDIFQQYRKEVHLADQWLYQTSRDAGEVWRLLKEAQPHDIEGCIHAGEVEKQRKSILTEQFPDKKGLPADIGGNIYITKKTLEGFIQESVNLLPEILKGRKGQA